jgi:Flp pilus assembly protein TadD
MALPISNKDRAVELYEEVLKTNPDHQAVINNLASLLTDEYASAENINRAVKLTERFADSEQPYFVDTYAWALIKADLPEVAEPLLAKVTEVAPAVAVFHYHRGVGLSRLGRQDEAKKSLLRARDLASSDASLQAQISVALSDLKAGS